MSQLREQETRELQEDIQTLTRENKFVNSEFGKTAQAADYLKKTTDELTNRERHATQALRAMEMEKEDIL